MRRTKHDETTIGGPLAIGAVALLLTALLPGSAGAFSVFSVGGGDYVHWNSDTVTFWLHEDDWNDINTRSAALGARNRWNDNPANIQLSVLEDNDGFNTGNGENEIAWTNNAALVGDAPARCLFTYNSGNGHLQEADVFMNTAVSWSNSTSKANLWPYGGPHRPMQTTLLHELGHAIGLGHEKNQYNVMGQDWDFIHVNGGTVHFYSGEDANSGAVFLYGLDSVDREDVSVAHWKQTGYSGEYSVHDRTRIRDNSGLSLYPYTEADEPYYLLSPGTRYRLELTYENNGSDSHTVDLLYVLSTNHYISTADTVLREKLNEMTIGRNTPYLATHYVDIPEAITPGEYWIGVVMDHTSEISEVRENNNATYVAKVKIMAVEAAKLRYDRDASTGTVWRTQYNPRMAHEIECQDTSIDPCYVYYVAPHTSYPMDLIDAVRAYVEVNNTSESTLWPIWYSWDAFYWDGSSWGPVTYEYSFYDAGYGSTLLRATEYAGFDNFDPGSYGIFTPLIRYEMSFATTEAIEFWADTLVIE